jgi:hypothetical protein
MMHVPVHDHDALAAKVLHSAFGSHGDIVEKTEAHGGVLLGVVTRGPAHGFEFPKIN